MSVCTHQQIELLAALADLDDAGDGEYRFLLDGKHVKYVTIAPGCIPTDDRTFGPMLIPLLPAFPPGDWNEGHIARNSTSGQLELSTRSITLPGVTNAWHQTKIDHLELVKLERVRQNIYKVSHDSFDRPVLVKFAAFPYEVDYIELETTAYQALDGTGIGPRFLGHVTEAGRITGFLIEYVDGARTAQPGDVADCRAALAKLHALSFRHGDLNKHNMLVSDHGVTMIDFETLQRCESHAELDAEFATLEAVLADTSGRGGVVRVTDEA